MPIIFLRDHFSGYESKIGRWNRRDTRTWWNIKKRFDIPRRYIGTAQRTISSPGGKLLIVPQRWLLPRRIGIPPFHLLKVRRDSKRKRERKAWVLDLLALHIHNVNQPNLLVSSFCARRRSSVFNRLSLSHQ